MLEDLIYHKDKWKKLCNMSIKNGFYEYNIENFDCIKNSIQDLINEEFDEV